MKVFWERGNWQTQNGHNSEMMVHSTFCLWIHLMKGSEKAQVTLSMTEGWSLYHMNRCRLQLQNKRTRSTRVMVAMSQRSTTLSTYLWRSVKLTAVLESLVIWYRHNYTTQFLKSQNQVLESRGHHHFLCKQAMSSTAQHVGPHYHSSKYCAMGCHLSSYNDAAMGQFVHSMGQFVHSTDRWTPCSSWY
jgi:hypothetical protein